MRCNSFGRSLLFAAVAVALWLPFAVLFVPWVGFWTTRGLYMVLGIALYIFAIAAKPAHGMIVAVAALAAGLVVASVASSDLVLLAGLGVVVSTARSGFLYRASALRAFGFESILLAGSVWFAADVIGPTLIGCALSIWAFFLVQSCFFLLPRPQSGDVWRHATDPFDGAHQRALALLEEDLAQAIK